jgi:hypothetical protein
MYIGILVADIYFMKGILCWHLIDPTLKGPPCSSTPSQFLLTHVCLKKATSIEIKIERLGHSRIIGPPSADEEKMVSHGWLAQMHGD